MRPLAVWLPAVWQCDNPFTHEARPLVVTSSDVTNAPRFLPSEASPADTDAARAEGRGGHAGRSRGSGGPPTVADVGRDGGKRCARGRAHRAGAARGPGRRRPPRRGRRGGRRHPRRAVAGRADNATAEAAEHRPAGRVRQAPDTDDPRAQVRARKSRAPAAPHAKPGTQAGSRSPDSTRAPGTLAATKAVGPKASSPRFTTTTSTGARRTTCRWRTTWTTTA